MTRDYSRGMAALAFLFATLVAVTFLTAMI
jgi:hypothetical protein